MNDHEPKRDITNGAWGWVIILPLIVLLRPFVWLYQVLTLEDWRNRRRWKKEELLWKERLEHFYAEKEKALRGRDVNADAAVFASGTPEQRRMLREEIRALLGRAPGDSARSQGFRRSSDVYRGFEQARGQYLAALDPNWWKE